MLEAVGLAHRAEHRPERLSGGERQRVAIARALVHAPVAVLADEPTGNLDSASGEAVLSILERLRRERGTTVVVATHDPTLLERADRCVGLKDGRLHAVEPGGARA
jgi:putative ABC transport system ATP-binding protein